MADYFKRRWDESRGDAHDDWGASWWLFEVGDDGYPERQIEIYDRGPTKRYGPNLPRDEDGGLGDVRLEDAEDWSEWRITEREFDAVWHGDD